MVIGKCLPNTSAGISLPKAKISSICMKDGDAFSFDPANDDIEEYIRDVKEAAKQLGHGDNACGKPAQGHHANRTYMALFMAIITSHFFAPCSKTSMLRSHSLPLPHPPPPLQVLQPHSLF